MALVVAAVAVRASEPFLLRDIDLTASGSYPTSFVELGGSVYFIALDVRHGRELWASDGSGEGTRRITDLSPGSAGSLSTELVVFAGRLFFPATAAGEGAGLWSSDGSEEGTARVGGIEETGADVRQLTVSGDRLFYTARLGPQELLWVSDGTPDGTFPLVPESGCEGSAGSTPHAPRRLTPAADADGGGAALFFIAELEGVGRSLWSTDGTSCGTFPLTQVADPIDLATVGGRIVAAVETRPNVESWELWASDGSEMGTERILDVTSSGGPYIDLLTTAGGHLFFTLSDGYGGFELWVTDSTAAGTRLVDELRTEEPEEVPRLASYTRLGDRLYFQGFHPASGYELWVSDGTADGTRLVSDIVHGAEGSRPLGLTAAGDALFFSAATPEQGRELWRIVGLSPPERPVALLLSDAVRGPADSDPGSLRYLGERLWLSMSDDASGPEPWISDGSPSGTRKVAALNREATASSRPIPVGSVGPVLFFTLAGDAGHWLWRSDGTPRGTNFVVRSRFPAPAPLADPFQQTLAAGGFLYFVARSSTGVELWRSTFGASELTESLTNLDAEAIATPVAVALGVLFTAVVEHGLALYRYADGSTTRLADLGAAPSVASPRLLGGTTLAFILVPVDGGSRALLWVSDGTSAGTRRVTTVSGEALHLAAQAVGDRLFFVSTTPETGNELWTSDGTAAGTRLAVDLDPGEASGNPSDFAFLDGWLYFRASAAGDDFDDIANVWRIDVEATVFERVHRACVERLVGATWSLFFVPCSRRNALWVLEGEPPVRRQVAIVEPDFPSSFPLPVLGTLSPGSGFVYFTVEDAENHQTLPQIWMSDGTEEGTRVFTDAPFGAPSSEPPHWVRPAGGVVFFDADDGIHGRELWAAPLECVATGRTLCLGDDRFQAVARWRDFAGRSAVATSVPVSNESGGFWFFDESNPELFLKVLDGRQINDRFWAFFGSLSNVGIDLSVLDTRTGAERLYRNPRDRFASFGDTEAFDDDSWSSAVVVSPPARPPEDSTGSGAVGSCTAGPEVQCQLGRFQIEVTWQDFEGQIGRGRVRGLSGGLEGFWFFDPENVELVVKVLDGRQINGRYWVFFGSLTNVRFELVVTDVQSGVRRTYRNPAASFASFGDTAAFLP